MLHRMYHLHRQCGQPLFQAYPIYYLWYWQIRLLRRSHLLQMWYDPKQVNLTDGLPVNEARLLGRRGNLFICV